jgi:O-antigen/teichoic acid export membrane protein
MHLLFARLLGPVEFGYFAYAMNWALLLATVANMGMDSASMKFVAALRTRGDKARLQAFLLLASRVVLFGVVVSAIAAAFSDSLVGEPGQLTRWLLYPVPVTLMALLAFSLLFQSELLGAAQGLSALGPDKIARPALTILFAVVALRVWPGQLDALSALVVATFAAAVSLLFLFLIRRARLVLSTVPHSPVAGEEKRDWILTAGALYLVGLCQIILARGGVVAVGMLNGATDAGIFFVVVSLASLVFFVLSAANGAIAPRIAALYYSGNRTALEAMVRHYTWLFIFLAIPILLILIIFAKPILALFGPIYMSAVPALEVTVLGQFIMVLGGPVGALLTMTRHQRPAAVAISGVALIYVCLNLWWIPVNGLIGAAWALTVVISIRTLWLTALVWRHLRLAPPLLMPFFGTRSERA